MKTRKAPKLGVDIDVSYGVSDLLGFGSKSTVVE